MNDKTLLERAKNSEVIGDGSTQISLLVFKLGVLEGDLERETELHKTTINLATEYQRLLEKVRDNRNEIKGLSLEEISSVKYTDGYRDGQEFQANMIREMLP